MQLTVLSLAWTVCSAYGFLPEPPAPNATDNCLFFTAMDESWFQEWRDRLIRPLDSSLWAQSDPSTRDRAQIQAVLLPILLPRGMLDTVRSTTGESDFMAPTIRAIYSLKIMSDLRLVPGDGPKGHRLRYSMSPPEGDIASHNWVIMTFQLAVASSPRAIGSLRIIAAAHGVPLAKLVEVVGRIGAKEGARWFNVFLGLSSSIFQAPVVQASVPF